MLLIQPGQLYSFLSTGFLHRNSLEEKALWQENKSKTTDVQPCICGERSELLLPALLRDPWRFVGEPEQSRRGWGQGRGVRERDSPQRGSGSFSLLALSVVTQEKKPFETVSDAARSCTKHASLSWAPGADPEAGWE